MRRAGVGVIHRDTLTLEQEFRVLEAAVAAGVRAPRPITYLGEVDGREAFAMERVDGETIGRRIVRDPPPGLPIRWPSELAKIHSIVPRDFLPRGGAIERFYDELDRWRAASGDRVRARVGARAARRVSANRRSCHGDFRLGNLAVYHRPRRGLDWEFAHVGDPVEDVAWPLVRAWRFGADERQLGGVGDVEPYLERYNELTGETSRSTSSRLGGFGNVKWAIGCLTQSRRHLNGQDRSVEYAVLGRMAAEMEYELLDLIERALTARPRPSSSRRCFEFLAEEVLPNAPTTTARSSGRLSR